METGFLFSEPFRFQNGANELEGNSAMQLRCDVPVPMFGNKTQEAAQSIGTGSLVSGRLEPVQDGVPQQSVPVTKTRKQDGLFESETRSPLYMGASDYAFEIKNALGKPPFKKDASQLVILDCIDPKWGRSATRLYKAVIESLKKS